MTRFYRAVFGLWIVCGAVVAASECSICSGTHHTVSQVETQEIVSSAKRSDANNTRGTSPNDVSSRFDAVCYRVNNVQLDWLDILEAAAHFDTHPWQQEDPQWGQDRVDLYASTNAASTCIFGALDQIWDTASPNIEEADNAFYYGECNLSYSDCYLDEAAYYYNLYEQEEDPYEKAALLAQWHGMVNQAYHCQLQAQAYFNEAYDKYADAHSAISAADGAAWAAEQHVAEANQKFGTRCRGGH